MVVFLLLLGFFCLYSCLLLAVYHPVYLGRIFISICFACTPKPHEKCIYSTHTFDKLGFMFQKVFALRV